VTDVVEPNKARLRLWVEGLRSRRFAQTDQKLADSEGYCCLGVACEIAIENGLDLEKEQSEDGDWRYGDDFVLLPLKVADWYGFPGGLGDKTNPIIGVYDEDIDPEDDEYEGFGIGDRLDATDANDELHWNFEKIANTIEEHYGLNEED
jgi:hypothetical protein